MLPEDEEAAALFFRAVLAADDASDVQKQACEPHLRLGEIAVREGFCTQRDVLKAVQRQRETNPHPLEILLAEDSCDSKRLNKVLVRYIRQLEARNADLPS